MTVFLESGSGSRSAMRGLCALAGVLLLVAAPAGWSDRSTPDTPFVSTYLGTGDSGYAPEGESRYHAAIAEPYGLASDASGNLYFSDYENNRVGRIDARSGTVTTAAEIKAPQGIALDGRGGLYVGSMLAVVWRIDLKTGNAEVIAGGGIAQESTGLATAIALGAPSGVNVDSIGQLYIADANLHAVFRFDPATGRLAIVVGQRGRKGFDGDGGPAIQALLSSPADVAIDRAGDLYIADLNNQVIRRVDSHTGRIRTLAGTPGVKGFSGDGGSVQVRFNGPMSLQLSGDGRLLVADVFNHRLRELDLRTGVVTTVAGTGSKEYLGENIAVDKAPLPYPASIAVGPMGTLYVSSPRANRIFAIGAPSVIPQPWWMSPWRWLAAVLTLALFLYGIAEMRGWQLRARARSLEAGVELRTHELAVQKAVVQEQADRLASLGATKDQLLTRISSEFRTPLDTILGTLSQARENVSSSEERRYLDVVERNASRLLRLVDQMLGLARVRSVPEESSAPIEVARLLAEIVDSFGSLAADRDIALLLEQTGPVVLHISADSFEKIAVNLVSNAIKYTVAGGRVTVSLTTEGRMGVLVVCDTGRGIASEWLERIFQPFERAHDEAERIPGSGLGLALVRQLVDANSGVVTVASVPGQGSTFRVCLPRDSAAKGSDPSPRALHSLFARTEAAALRSDSVVPPPMAVTERILPIILVVEDNVDMLRYVLDVLAPHYCCLQADDGHAAVTQAISAIPDVVVSDIMLPGQDGFALCRALKRDPRTGHIPVILLTALEDQDHRLRGLGELADDYLAKPFSEAELLLRIRNLLDLRSLLQARYSYDLRFERGQPEDLSPADRKFLAKLGRLVDEQHSDPALDLPAMASALAMSERQLQRKLKALVGLTPGEYLRESRLQRAYARLTSGERPGGVAAKSGFSSQTHFTSCFKAKFGYPPGEARERARRRA